MGARAGVSLSLYGNPVPCPSDGITAWLPPCNRGVPKFKFFLFILPIPSVLQKVPYYFSDFFQRIIATLRFQYGTFHRAINTIV